MTWLWEVQLKRDVMQNRSLSNNTKQLVYQFIELTKKRVAIEHGITLLNKIPFIKQCLTSPVWLWRAWSLVWQHKKIVKQLTALGKITDLVDKETRLNLKNRL